MKIKTIIHSIILVSLISSNTVNARQTKFINSTFNTLPSSPLANSQAKQIDNEFLSCKADLFVVKQITISQRNNTIVDNLLPESLEYLNDMVLVTYNTMRNGVINYVTKKIALSLLNFSVDGFATESIASYVSDGTKTYLPFEFANGVKITKVTPLGNTIIYRAEMPITKNHRLAKPLALAGKVTATATICNDMDMVDDLLGRHINIQYDYYDANGELFSSFTING